MSTKEGHAMLHCVTENPPSPILPYPLGYAHLDWVQQ